jgi:hypothetical protein
MPAPRQLSTAVTLRPADVWQLYGIAPSTLHGYCRRETNPLPSILIRGKSGRKGVRLVRRDQLESWLTAQAATGA